MQAKTASAQGAITRRRFCNRVLLASTTLTFSADALLAQDAKRHDGLVAYPPWKIAGAASVLPGSFLYFSYPTANDAAVLLRTCDGQYFAFARKCAHLGCTVDFNDARRSLVCPCHQGAYDMRTGFVLFGPPRRPLDSIVLQMRTGGEIWAVGKAPGNSSPNA